MKYLKNITSSSADFYVYGDIVDEKYPDYWTGEYSSNEIDTNELKNELDDLQNVKDLNIYINSPGGSVFASSTMVSLLKRFKQNTGAKIHGFIDGLCASAATYLLMVADDINVYQNSILMIHKPLTFSFGNANDLQKDIDILNVIENDMMIPMYMNKSLVDEETLKELVNNETWFNGNKQDDMFIGNFFRNDLRQDIRQLLRKSSTFCQCAEGLTHRRIIAAGFRVAAPSVMGRYGTASDKRRFSKGSMQHIKLC